MWVCLKGCSSDLAKFLPIPSAGSPASVFLDSNLLDVSRLGWPCVHRIGCISKSKPGEGVEGRSCRYLTALATLKYGAGDGGAGSAGAAALHRLELEDTDSPWF